jgi:two-component system, LytTR family, response regulator
MSIPSLIIDDDPFMHTLLRDKLAQHFPDVEVLADGMSGQEGLALIEAHRPALIFLDVEMTDMTGFDMLRKVQNPDFQVIFTTSYSHYAIKAIRFNALDYIVKPVDIGELDEALARFRARSERANYPDQLSQALQNLTAERPEEQVLMLAMQDGELRVPLKHLLRIEGERNYSYLFIERHPRRLSSKNLGEFEEMLSDKGFFRCHRSHLVNGLHVASVQGSSGLTLTDGAELPISRRKKEVFLSWYQAYRAG